MKDQNKLSKNYVFYEVNLKINADIIFKFDEWLKDHVKNMLGVPGFLSASVVIPEITATIYQYRTIKYRIENKATLDSFFDHHAEKMLSTGEAKFRNQFTATRKVYIIPIDEATEAFAEQSVKG